MICDDIKVYHHEKMNDVFQKRYIFELRDPGKPCRPPRNDPQQDETQQDRHPGRESDAGQSAPGGERTFQEYHRDQETEQGAPSAAIERQPGKQAGGDPAEGP